MRDTSESYYRNLFATQKARTEKVDDILASALLVLTQKKSLYMPAEALTSVPWIMFGLTHYRECSCRPERQILNGERFDQKTTIVPKGLGPFASWEEAAVIAARRQGWLGIKAWPVETVLNQLERHNGYGYARRNLSSPYLWAGTQHYDKGKFVADGRFDPDAVDKQIGVAPILQSIILAKEFSFT